MQAFTPLRGCGSGVECVSLVLALELSVSPLSWPCGVELPTSSLPRLSCTWLSPCLGFAAVTSLPAFLTLDHSAQCWSKTQRPLASPFPFSDEQAGAQREGVMSQEVQM